MRAKRGARRPSTPEARAEARKAKAAARTRRRGQEREKAKANRPAEPVPDQAPRERVAGSAKIRLGIVVSDKADKTITVRIDTARRHRKYEKIVRSSTTLHAHDEANTAGAGDRVKIIECRPLSRLKRWRLVEVMERAK
ncbi:MAG: 30S ribosomal protein S17 [Solirubrobacterales bacterium]|nr:30S ribosomal protein S17 [Solirubrobacterales bacterium]